MNRTLARTIALLLTFLISNLSLPLFAQQQQTPAQQPSGSTTQPPVELPDNPGSQQQNTTQPQPSAQTPPQNEPSGTAVAPPVEVSGGAASKPAGVAIAPPKQRQIRSYLLKFGLLAGAGIAIGTVVGLSAASPGRVPNSPSH